MAPESRSKVLGAVVAAVVVVAAVAAASFAGLLPIQGVFTPAGVEKEEILIGFSIAMSGPGAPAGTEQLRAYQVWAEWVNSKGGIYVKELGKRLPVKLVYYDDESQPSKAVSIYEKLITEDKVDLLLAPWGTFIHLAIIPVLEKYGYPVVGNTAGVPDETLKDLKTNLLFLTWPSPKLTAKAFLEFVRSLPDIERVAILYAQTDFTVANAREMKELFEKAGYQIVAYEGYPLTITDASGILLKLKDLKPDAIIVHSYPSDALLITAQSKELDVNTKLFILGVGGQLKAFAARFDDQTKQGVVTINSWHPAIHRDAEELYKLYIEKYGDNPPSHTLGLAWLSAIVLQQAVEKAGTLDPGKIAEVLSTETFETPFGTVRFIGQQSARPLIVFEQWQNGRLEAVFVVEVDLESGEVIVRDDLRSADLIYPKPRWS